MKLVKSLILATAALTSFVSHAGLIDNVVGLQAQSVTTTSELGGYLSDVTIDRTDYVSGVTSWTDIEALSYDTTNYHTQANASTGTITWDLGAVYNMDRVRIDWTNGGGANNFADFTIQTSNDALFTSATTVYSNFGAPTSTFETIDFTTLGVGQYIRLDWTSTQGTYGGMRELIVGVGEVNNVSEPATLAMLSVLMLGLAARRRNS